MRAIRSKKPDEPTNLPYASVKRTQLQPLAVSSPGSSPTGHRSPSLLEAIELDMGTSTTDASAAVLSSRRTSSSQAILLPQGLKSNVEEREAELSRLTKEYEDALQGLGQDREVLQQEVQRVLQLERQREEELTHAVNVNQALNEEITELRDSISAHGVDSAQNTLLKQLNSQVEALEFERDKALLEMDGLYAEIQALQNQADESRSASPSKGKRDLEELTTLESEVVELSQDLEHGYQVMETLKDEIDKLSDDCGEKLRDLIREKEAIGKELSRLRTQVLNSSAQALRSPPQVSAETEGLRLKVKELEQQLIAAWDQQDAAETDLLASSMNEVEEKDAQLEQVQAENERLLRELAAAQAGKGPEFVSDSDSDSTANEADVVGLRHRIDELLDSLEKEMKEHDGTKKLLDQLQVEHKEILDMNRGLMKETKEGSEREEQLTEKMAAMEKQLLPITLALHQAEENREDNSPGELQQEVDELKRKLQESRGLEDAGQEAIREMNGRVQQLEDKLKQKQTSFEAAELKSMEAQGKARLLEEELQATLVQLEEAAMKASSVAVEEEGVAGARESRELLLQAELKSANQERERAATRCTVLQRELQNSDAQLLEMRRTLKGSGMLTNAEGADLRRQLDEAHEEVRFLKDKVAFAAADALQEVHQELSAAKESLADARRKQQAFVQEESDARQMLMRHTRRMTTDLKAEADLLRKEVESIQRRQSQPVAESGPPSPVSSRANLSVRTEFALEDRIQALETRNRQLEFQARQLEASRELSDLKAMDRERERLMREAESVRAESEFKLRATLNLHEEEYGWRGGQQTAGFTGRLGSPRDMGSEERHYRSMRARIDELESRLLDRIGRGQNLDPSGTFRGDGIERQMRELMEAQRGVSEALVKLAESQSDLQEWQVKAEQQEQHAKVPPGRRSVETPSRDHMSRLVAEGRRRSTSSPSSPLRSGRRQDDGVSASFNEWTVNPMASLTPPAHQAAVSSVAYLDPAVHGNTISTPVQYQPPSMMSTAPRFGVRPSPVAATPVAPIIGTPGAGVNLLVLNQFAPPSWRVARGLAPSFVPFQAASEGHNSAGATAGSLFGTPVPVAAPAVQPRSNHNPGTYDSLTTVGNKDVPAIQQEAAPDVTAAPSGAYIIPTGS